MIFSCLIIYVGHIQFSNNDMRNIRIDCRTADPQSKLGERS